MSQVKCVIHISGKLVLQVRGWFQSCGRGGSCTCAVAVRSGDDVLIIDSCDRPDGSELPLDTTLYKNGELTPGTVIVSENEGKVHKVSLFPHCSIYVSFSVSEIYKYQIKLV